MQSKGADSQEIVFSKKKKQSQVEVFMGRAREAIRKAYDIQEDELLEDFLCDIEERMFQEEQQQQQPEVPAQQQQQQQQMSGGFQEESLFNEDSTQTVEVDERVVKGIDRILQTLEAIGPDFEDPQYSFEKFNKELFKGRAATAQQSQKNWQLKWEALKLAQKEKFQKYENEELKAAVFELDERVDEDFSYSLVYSQGGRNKEIQIKHYDLMKLNPPNYLNDTIINFYLKFMELELIPSELRNKVYIFNTYFMDKLCPYDKVSQIALSDQIKLGELFLKCYDNIKKWVKEDLFSKDYLLFPLNLPEHWSLIIAQKPGEVFRNDFNPEKNDSFIVYLDSFGLIDNRLIQIIKMYLHKNYSEKAQSDSSFADSAIANLAAYQLLVPRQVNYIDCGCFLLEYAETFLSNPSAIVDGIQDYGSQVKLRWFPRVLISKKRYFIKRLIVGLKEKGKDGIVQEYRNERAQLLEQSKDNDDEYDVIDEAQFADFLSMKTVKDPTPEQRQQLLLDFYMNPNYNYYHIDPVK